MGIHVRHWTGEETHLSVKEAIETNDGFYHRTTYVMDSKKVNELHPSQYDKGCTDFKVYKIVRRHNDNQYYAWVRYRTQNGWTQGLQAVDLEILSIAK